LLVGIDVGGTYTDAALIHNGRVVKTVKIPTSGENLLDCLLAALDGLLEDTDPRQIERIVLSTTLITNLLVQDRLEPVPLLLVPGPGANPDLYGFPKPHSCIPGAIDYRGREIAPLDLGAAADALRKFAREGFCKVAVAGKFSPRNPAHELKIAELAAKSFPQMELGLSHQVCGFLNFPRRAITTWLTMATRLASSAFVESVNSALKARRLGAPTYLLKADGGALPLGIARDRPVETVFSGPAASALGALALAGREESAVVMDVGGTTTDLALILDGQPLLASRGIAVQGWYTHIRALAVRSLPVGGDSAVTVEKQELRIGSERRGPAYCLGGPAPTPTDALRYLGLTEIGDRSLAEQAMAEIGRVLGISPEQAAARILKQVVDQICRGVEEMFMTWEQEPAYRIWEVMRRKKGRPKRVIGLGGGAKALVPKIAQALGGEALIPLYAPSANAIGAALARPTAYVTLHADTERGIFTIEEVGRQEPLPKTDRFSLEEARELARRYLALEAARVGADYDVGETIYAEEFNLVRGWRTVGRIFHVVMQVPPGIVRDLEG
jgi:N-methylhydantoinase A/oxoprolinase/acetone carboxylase beta subunit